MGHDGLTELAAPWCKVRAMLAAMDDHPRASVFMYLDSDAAVGENFTASSLKEIAAHAGRYTPTFADGTTPVALSRDGPGYWCQVLWQRKEELPPWDSCLNAGVVLWKRSPAARAFLEAWWRSALECCDHFPNGIRVWPWEQTSLQYVAHDHAPHVVAVPDYVANGMRPARHLVWPPQSRYKECVRPFCLAHVPGACCVVSHHCQNEWDKLRLARRALDDVKRRGALPIKSADLPLLDFRANQTARFKGRGAKTGMISPEWAL